MMETIRYEKRGAIALAAVNRPKALNALNSQVLQDLARVVDQVEEDREVRAFVLTGEGRAFVAGADIGEQQALEVAGALAFSRFGSALFRRIEQLPLPTIAAVNGFCLGGGCELAMAFDIILAADTAKFGQPEVSLGITPGFSGTQRLPRRVGVARAKELLYSGRMISAAEAEKIGLVNGVCAPEALMDTALAMAGPFAKNAPAAIRNVKAAVDRGAQLDMDSAIALENQLYALCFATEDCREGLSAFLEKRSPEFRNR